jgi:type IV secretory pathway TrbL component
MSKFLKFNIVNTGALATQGTQLVNVEQIESVVYTGGTGALTITLAGGVGVPAAGGGQAAYTVPAFVAGATDISGSQAAYDVPVLAADLAGSFQARVISSIVATTKDGTAGVPTITNGAKSPQKAVYAAMTANPGGVQSTVQLGLDEAVVPVQMYFSSFAIATASIV